MLESINLKAMKSNCFSRYDNDRVLMVTKVMNQLPWHLSDVRAFVCLKWVRNKPEDVVNVVGFNMLPSAVVRRWAKLYGKTVQSERRKPQITRKNTGFPFRGEMGLASATSVERRGFTSLQFWHFIEFLHKYWIAPECRPILLSKFSAWGI